MGRRILIFLAAAGVLWNAAADAENPPIEATRGVQLDDALSAERTRQDGIEQLRATLTQLLAMAEARKAVAAQCAALQQNGDVPPDVRRACSEFSGAAAAPAATDLPRVNWIEALDGVVRADVVTVKSRRWLKQGDAMDGFKLLEIRDGEVVFQGPQGKLAVPVGTAGEQ